jgi:excisionase family DNA binding protein
VKTRTGVALLRIEQVAERTGVAVSTLRHWRAAGTGPKSARIGRRVVYRADDVEDWINAQFDESA